MKTLEKKEMSAELIRKTLRGGDLPLVDWQKEFDVKPEQLISIEKTRETPDKIIKITLEVKESEIKKEQQKTRSKWAKVAKKFKKEKILSGTGDFVRKQSKEFREDFSFKHDDD